MPRFGAGLPLLVNIASVSYDADVNEARVVVERVFEFAPSRAREDNSALSHAAAGDRGRAS